MLTLLFSLGVFVLSLALRLAHKLRLTIPLLYMTATQTVLRSWYLSHTALATLVLYAILSIVAISWLVSLARIVSDAIEARAADSAAMERFTERVRQARANGESIVSTEGLW